MSGVVFAHQGGWDEMLLVLLPLLIFGGLLRMARRRAEQMNPPDPDRTTGPDDERS